ncbi:family 2 encapsulin nanocompartment cargo protein terpene cyclase [Streptomyces sp. NPDC001262]|uniref:family 2 encapsulin nanocompartment cargo protein terpene cyclase n=1 Tax=unclassified Streptomyces TaxID=2593676 RepID=UPI00369AE70C
MPRLPGGPTGLGTSAAHLRPAGDGIVIPPLHCPRPLRDDRGLGEELDERLVEWAGQVGIYPGRLDELRATGFGRLVMLCHPGTDQVERLLIPARCTLAAWAVDDHYCDDPGLGAVPELTGSRLGITAATVDRVRLPDPFAAGFEQAVRDDPALRAVRSAVEHLARLATPVQTARARHIYTALLTALGQEASWRAASRTPPVWEYLINRQANSFQPCLAVIDVVGGYELAPQVWADHRVQHAFATAALAASLVNDLYSVAREGRSAIGDFNLALAVAAEDGCTLQEAVDRSAALHDDLMRRFETQAAELSLTGPPELCRFLAGITAWCGGNHAWHQGSPRYASRPTPARSPA